MKQWVVFVLLYVSICEGFRYAWRPSTKVFPYETFPEPQIIDNGDNNGKAYKEIVTDQKVKNENNTCVKVWIGNGACNRENNKAECSWDGGDCCWASCIKNCPTGGISTTIGQQNQTNITNSSNSNSTTQQSYKCKFACGSFKGYECRQPNQSCQECGSHGKCLPQSECLKGNATYTQRQIVGDLIQNCYSISWSQGNGATINIFCGKDPYKTILHDPVYPKLHYPGCGFFQSQCTLLPLCDDVLNNGITAQNCDNVTRPYNFYSESLQTVIQNSTSCYMHFLESFIKNYRYFGQCCQCERGWTGIDCSQAVCYPTCIHGSCIAPNVCVCDAGWQGVICQIGICTLCEYGVCTAPEVCECFYGYEGTSCNIPISMPPCHHGFAVLPDICQCDEGFQGRICDQPICESSCGPHGHCIAPNTCECDIGWESSDPLSQCDIVNALLQDPNCIEADNDHCTACDEEFYLDPVDYTCNKCNAVFNEMCIMCNYLQCLECQWPFDVDPESSVGDCVSTGVVEFTDIALDVIEDQKYVFLNVRRNFGQKGLISVYYDMSSTFPENTRIEKAQGKIDFLPGQEISNITLNVFKRFEFESSESSSEVETQDTVFVVRLLYTNNRAEIGDRDHVILHYFDSYSLPDTRNTYSLFYGLRSPVSRINGQSFTVDIGKYYTLDIYSYYLASMPKLNGQTERYYLIQRDEFKNQVREISTSVYLSSNHHQVSFWCYDASMSVLDIYASTSGMAVSYFSNTRFTGTPYLYRLEYLFPIMMQDRQPIKQHSQYSIKYDFIVEFSIRYPQLQGIQNFTFTLRTAEFSLTSVFINDIQIQSLEIPYQECPGNYDPDGSSCCLKNFTYNTQLNTSQPQHFIVKYIQRRKAFNGPCIKFFRQTPNLPINFLDQDGIAIEALREGYYAFSTNVTDAIVDSKQGSLIYKPGINPNSKTQIAINQFQNCVPNNFQVIIRDIFGTEFTLIPSLNVTVTFTIADTVITNSTVYNSTDSSRRTTIYYCGAIGQAKVVARIKGDVMPDSLTLNVIPGPYQLSQSDIVEWNQQTSGCQAHTQCQAKLDLRDRAGNLILIPIALTQKDADFQLLNNNSTHYAEMFNTFQVQQTQPYSIFIFYIPRSPGSHSLFARFQGQKAKVYPLTLEVFSTVASDTRSYITDASILSPRIVTLPLTFQVQLCDILGNNLTDSTYVFAAKIQSVEQPSIVIPQLSASKVGISLYSIQIIAYVSSNYSLSIKVTNQATGLQVQLNHQSIFTIQTWQSHLVNRTTTTVIGSAFQSVFPQQPASIALQLRDSQQNYFNSTFHANTYLPLPIYNITVIAGANTLIEVKQESQNPDVGFYTFSFLVPTFYPQLTIFVQVSELKAGYFNISGSPFTTPMSQRSETLYCEIINLHQAGYGLTAESYIVSQPPQVVAGQNFSLQLVGINTYNTIYQPTIDPVQKLFIVDQVKQDCTCSQNSAICNHFSGNYTQCVMNKQCRWSENSQTSSNANLFSCQPCNSSCNSQSFTLVTAQSRDAVYSYYTMQVLQQGTVYTQVNVVSQGFLRMMIFKNYDYTGYYEQVNIYDLQNLTFNSNLSPFFATKRQMWSASILGYIRYNQTQQGCYSTIQNRLEITNDGRTLVTWTLTNDLDSVVFLNGVQVLEKQASQTSAQFFKNCTDNEVILFEIRLRIKRPIPTANNGFMSLEQETFKSPRNTVLPFNIFYVVPSTTSLKTQITVLPAAASSATSQVQISNCTNGRVPYSTDITVKVLDQYGNQRALSQSDNMTISITKDSQFYSTINITQQDQTTKLYNLTVNLAEQGKFTIFVNLNNIKITNQPDCRFVVYSQEQITTIAKAAFLKYNTYFLEPELDQNEAREFYRADLLQYGKIFDESNFQIAFQRMDIDVNGSISENEAIQWMLDLATQKGVEMSAIRI